MATRSRMVLGVVVLVAFVLLLVGLSVSRLLFWPRPVPAPMVRAESPVVAPSLASTGTPWPPTGQMVLLDVHVEARADGEGSAHVVASSQGGQALAHIDTKGAAKGEAVANAPSLKSSVPTGQGGMLPLDAIEGAVNPPLVVAVATGQALILGDVVNLRAGPGPGYLVVGVVRAGDSLPITGQSVGPGGAPAWWRVCCASGSPAWVNGAYVVQASTPRPEAGALGVRSSPVPTGQVEATATATPAPSATPLPTATPWPFTLAVQEQHSEANSAVVYAWVHVEDLSLDNYSLLITKDGQIVPGGTVATTGYRQGTTRPSAPGGAEDKPYNFKLAFDPRVVGQGFNPVGAWSVQLIDAQGRAAGPAALFALRVGDGMMEMYVGYSRK